MIKNIKIAHFCNDEKFIDDAYSHFEEITPMCNFFFIPSFFQKIQYIKKAPVTIISPLSFLNPLFMRSLENYDFIVLHSLTKFAMGLLTYKTCNMKFIWVGMGGDYYNIIFKQEDSLYQIETKKIINNEIEPNLRHNKLKEYIYRFLLFNGKPILELINRIDYFAPVLENEYYLVGKFGRGKKHSFPKFIDWNYGVILDVIESNSFIDHVHDNNILLGNSASLTNNHMDLLLFLRDQNLKNKKIICPLSYGNAVNYATFIEKKGKEFFGNNFEVLDKFLPFYDYIQAIRTCSNVIMNHNRQQASGVIILMMYMGAKVFLNKTNPLYIFLKKQGAILFSIEQLKQTPILLDIPLSPKDIKQNRGITLEYGKKAILGKTKNLIDTMLQK